MRRAPLFPSRRSRRPDGRAAAVPLGLAAALAFGAVLGSTADAQTAGPWAPTQLAPSDAGVQGARLVALSSDGAFAAFRHDGDWLAPGGLPSNPGGDPQIVLWREGRSSLQLTDTGAAPAGARALGGPSLDALGARAAFEGRVDPTGENPDHGAEIFLWDEVDGLAQASEAPAGRSATLAALSRDGRALAYWHDADPLGQNPAGVAQVFLARDGQPLAQLTAFDRDLYRDGLSLSGDASAPALAFIADADLTGDNPDGSWELFLWRGPVSSPGDPARFTQLTRWAPPMTGREIYHPSISADGRRVAFAGKGHVDESLPGGHIPAEIYLWTEGAGLARLTTATGSRTNSHLPRIADDGAHVAFVSQSDLAPGAPGNADGSTELFLWREGVAFAQATDSQERRGIISAEPALAPAADGAGRAAAFVSERDTSPAPLVLASRRGIPFRVALDGAGPGATPTGAPSPRPTTTSPPPSITPGPTGPAVDGRVCPRMAGRIPAAVQAAALANPAAFEGWLQPRNPALPPSAANPPRVWLTIRDPGKPYGRFNSALWKAGCP